MTIYGGSEDGSSAGFEYQCNRKVGRSTLRLAANTDDKLYGSTAPLGKRSGGQPLGIKTSVIRHYGTSTEQGLSPASNPGGT